MRIVVGGLGFMGSTHAGIWSRMKGVELYGVVSRDPDRLAGGLQPAAGNLERDSTPLDLTHVKKFRTLEEALRDPAIDAVDLCTPTGQHAPQAIASLQAGKHVLVEKPIALTGALADQVLAEAERTGRVLMAAQVLRFMPAYVRAKEILPQLGTVRSAGFDRRCAAPAWSKWLGDPQQSGGGAFDLLIHDVDYACWLFGAPGNARATGAVEPARGIDTLAGELEFEGFSASITGGWHLKSEYPFRMAFTMVCDEGVLEYSSIGGGLNLYPASGAKQSVELPDADAFEQELAHFRDCVKSGTPSSVCPPAESARAVKIMQALVTSRERR